MKSHSFQASLEILDFLSSAGGLFNCIAFNSPIFSEILVNKLSISLVM